MSQRFGLFDLFRFDAPYLSCFQDNFILVYLYRLCISVLPAICDGMDRLGSSDGHLLSVDDLICPDYIFIIGTLPAAPVNIGFFVSVLYGPLQLIFVDPFFGVAAVTVHFIAVCPLYPVPGQFDVFLRDLGCPCLDPRKICPLYVAIGLLGLYGLFRHKNRIHGDIQFLRRHLDFHRRIRGDSQTIRDGRKVFVWEGSCKSLRC